MKKQYLVIGLGRFGASLAVTLEDMGAEVMGIDASEDAVSAVADRITHCLIADTTEERVLQGVGVDQFDAAICAVASDFEASLMTTLLLREMGARHVVAKAATTLHGKVLEKIGADRVIYPERDVAVKLARDFMAPAGVVEVLPLTVQHSMFELKAPTQFAGRTLADLQLRNRFGLTVIAIRRGEETIVSPLAEDAVMRGDVLLVVGDRNQAREALKASFEDS